MGEIRLGSRDENQIAAAGIEPLVDSVAFVMKAGNVKTPY